jgi:hypothetical protein
MLQCRSSKISARKCLFGAGQISDLANLGTGPNWAAHGHRLVANPQRICAGPRHNSKNGISCSPRRGHFFQLARVGSSNRQRWCPSALLVRVHPNIWRCPINPIGYTVAL